MHVLVTRPGAESAARWRGLGHEVTAAPLLALTPRTWVPPPHVAALAFTSANGVAFAGLAARAYAALPVFAVGGATAAAARGAGFGDVRDGGGTAAALFAAVAAAGFARVLHLAGADRAAAAAPGVAVDVRIVYAADLVPLPEAVLAALRRGGVDLVPLYSPRTAAQFAAEVDRGGIDRATLRLAALSPAVAAAAGTGWADVAVAATPTEAALFAVAARVCDRRR